MSLPPFRGKKVPPKNFSQSLIKELSPSLIHIMFFLFPSFTVLGVDVPRIRNSSNLSQNYVALVPVSSSFFSDVAPPPQSYKLVFPQDERLPFPYFHRLFAGDRCCPFFFPLCWLSSCSNGRDLPIPPRMRANSFFYPDV